MVNWARNPGKDSTNIEDRLNYNLHFSTSMVDKEQAKIDSLGLDEAMDDLKALAQKVSEMSKDLIDKVSEQAEAWSLERFDLIQVHNLTSWQDHLANLEAMKQAGKIRYIGITTSHGRRHRELEKILQTKDLDFVQLTYNLTHREAEQRLLPLARERGIAVIANRPYDGGSLIKPLQRHEKVPAWAADELNCRTWADYLLRFIVSHPSVTCAIPATTQVAHMQENMEAGRGPMPDASQRQRMINDLRSL